jgi:hypothetical protein
LDLSATSYQSSPFILAEESMAITTIIIIMVKKSPQHSMRREES